MMVAHDICRKLCTSWPRLRRARKADHFAHSPPVSKPAEIQQADTLHSPRERRLHATHSPMSRPAWRRAATDAIAGDLVHGHYHAGRVSCRSQPTPGRPLGQTCLAHVEICPHFVIDGYPIRPHELAIRSQPVTVSSGCEREHGALAGSQSLLDVEGEEVHRYRLAQGRLRFGSGLTLARGCLLSGTADQLIGCQSSRDIHPRPRCSRGFARRRRAPAVSPL